MNRWLRRAAALLALVMAGTTFAHKPSDSYLTLAVDGSAITGQWDIALRDLDFALGLDTDQDGAITWGEVKAKDAAISALAFSHLVVGPAATPCVPALRERLIDNHSDGAYVVLRFTANCPSAATALDVDYRLFFDLDPQHRGLLNLTAADATRAGIFSAERPQQQFKLAAPSRWEQFVDYVREGVLHIWIGIDHVLFLLALLLPAVLVRSRLPGERWTGAANFRGAFWEVFKIVTAFTVAHSITLTLAVLGVIELPSRLVESAIAASVVLAALNNVRPVVNSGRWMLAFGFGLIHGFGFASVLAELGLPQDALLLSLLAFNVGVELGQLAIVAAFLPIAYALRNTWFYRRVVLVGGSLAVVVLAGLWLAERAFNLSLL